MLERVVVSWLRKCGQGCRVCTLELSRQVDVDSIVLGEGEWLLYSVSRVIGQSLGNIESKETCVYAWYRTAGAAQV